MTTTPREFERMLDDVDLAASYLMAKTASLRDDYRWSHVMAEGSGLRSGWAPRRVKGGDEANPTRDTAIDGRRKHARAKCKRAVVEANRALKAMENAWAALDELLGDDAAIKPARDPDPNRTPIAVSLADIERAKEAKAKREARGEGWGAA